jgi:hypothetical protein
VSTESLKFVIPKLPQLDKDDVKAIRSFLSGKLLARAAAFLSLVLLVLLSVGAIKFAAGQAELRIPTWAPDTAAASFLAHPWATGSDLALNQRRASVACKANRVQLYFPFPNVFGNFLI